MSENLSYFNYHLHTTYSNVSTIDSTNSVESMIIRAKELGQTSFTVSEHGNMISKYESASLCKDKKKGYNMKHICSVEAYFVKDRLAEIETDKIDKKTKLPTKVKDNTNAHMILIAKNYNGYKQLNTILSYANIDGFYSKARIDFDLINRYVNENDVIITTACFPKDTKVKTLDGIKNIQDVTSMDYVLTHNNVWKKVISPTTREFNGNFVEIIFDKKSKPIKSTENHQYYTLNVKDNTVSWTNARDLKLKDICLSPVEKIEYTNIKEFDLSEIISYKDNMGRAYKHQINTTIPITKELMMTFGLWLADGYIRSSEKSPKAIGFTFNEKEYDEYYSKFVQPAMNLFGVSPCIVHRKESHKYDIEYNSKQIWEFFQYLFGHGKSGTKAIPKILSSISKEMSASLLYGYLLGDGYFRYREGNGGEVVSTTISKDLNDGIKDLWIQLGSIPTERIVYGKTDNFGVCRQDAYYLTLSSSKLGKINKIDISLDIDNFIEMASKTRTSKLFISINNNTYIKKEIKSIKQYEDKLDVHCLNVEDDHSFTCEDIIVHNCVGGFVAKYGIEIIPEFQRFIDAGNFYLEFQAHNTDKQKEYNKIILDYAVEHNIPTTVACDTHIINENDDIFRDLLLRRKGIKYEEESGWTLDFPSGEELAYRFEIQNVVPADLIMESFRNTLKIAEECEVYDIIQYKLKIPVAKMHRHLSPQERKDLLKKIIYDEFDDYKKRDAYANENESKYIQAIEYELGEIFGCETYDYFLLNYFIVKRAKELGGVLTKTSRGSAGCYIVNMLLHFTAMDKFQFDLPLLPERFMTKERLLLSHSAPDIDMNVADQKAFYEASMELLGEEYVYPMIALGRVQEKTGWKIYAATNGVPIDKANEVSKAIDEYIKAKKYADEDAEIYIEDYIPKEYMEDFEKSKHFRSVVENIKAHPCGYCVSPVNLIEEVGLIKCKDVICVAMEGTTADKLGFVKNDFLVVSCVDITDKIYKKIGIPQPSPQELLRNLDERVWDIYEFGNTVEVNQFTANRTKEMMEKYKPKSITDLSSAVAFIRPGCASIVNKLVAREYYSFGVKEIDDILFAHTGIGSYVLYQESILVMLNYAGIDRKDTYTLLKAISKRKPEVIQAAKETFIEGMVRRIMEDKKE